MTRVRVIGNSTDSRRFYEFIKKIIEDNKIERIELRWEDVSSSTAESNYNVKKMPGLEIDGRLISEGKYNYTEKELLRFLR